MNISESQQNQYKRQNNTIKNLFNHIKSALNGTEHDYTSGSLKQAIFLLAVPMVLEMLMESVFAIVDIFFVSKLGADAIATVGLTESLITVIYAIAFGLSTATAALISRRIGEKRPEEAAQVAYQAIITGLVISIFIAIAGVWFSRDLLKLMGANANIIANMWGYTAIMLGSTMFIMLLFIINAVFRSAGDAAVSMRVLWIANIINIILDPILIFGLGPFPELGVTGAAIATSIGRGTGVIMQLYILFYGSSRIRLMWKNLKLNINEIFSIIKLALGAISQNLIATSSWIGLMRIVAVFGSEVLAGYTIAIRIVIFALLPSWGLSNAAATLVGQNLGAQQPKRAERSVWAAGKTNMILLGCIGLILIIYPQLFISLFVHDPKVLHYGSVALRIISFGFIFYGLGMVLLNSINGAGDTITPTKLNFISFWIIEIPLAYILAFIVGWKETGVFYAIIIAESTLTLLALIWFMKGKWKVVKI